jgi:signal transduction histidine kinase
MAEVLAAAGLVEPLDISRARPGAPVVVKLGRAEAPLTYEISVGQELDAPQLGHRLLVVRDVTASRLMEERLGHAQRLETVGQLAGGVAHDFNNLLTVIGGNAAMVADSGDPEVRESAQEILEAQERGSTLTRQLLAFARRDVRQPERVDLRSIVAGITRLLGRLLGERHRLVVAAGVPVHVFADRGQLEQLTINLVTNARDAMPGGGEVALTVRAVELAEAARLGSDLEAPRQALLEVADRGIGMSPETRARIFQPFFTTKARGQGTGLGLANVHWIVTQSGGRIALETALGQGSRFRVFLPVVEAAPEGAQATPEQAPHRTGTERVLLVEDDAAVAAMAQRVLARAGYRVAVVPDAERAQALLPDAAFDLLVSDVRLPGISGTELAGWLRRRQPGLRVLLVSGYADVEPGADAPGPAPLLRKPFTPDELLERVRSVLAAGSPER